MPPARAVAAEARERETEAEAEGVTVLTAFFWALVVLLLIAAVSAYL